MREDIKELVTSQGWKQLQADLEERKKGFVKQLIGAQDWDKVVRYQAALTEIHYLQRRPHELLQGEKDENESERE